MTFPSERLPPSPGGAAHDVCGPALLKVVVGPCKALRATLAKTVAVSPSVVVGVVVVPPASPPPLPLEPGPGPPTPTPP